MTVFFSGCVHDYYMVNSHNVPLLTRKGDAAFTGNFTKNGDDKTTNWNFQGNYAFTDHFGIYAGSMKSYDGWDHMIYQDVFRYNSVKYYFNDAGPGFFYPLNEFLISECFLGFGSG